jgi:hypothetical protein
LTKANEIANARRQVAYTKKIAGRGRVIGMIGLKTSKIPANVAAQKYLPTVKESTIAINAPVQTMNVANKTRPVSVASGDGARSQSKAMADVHFVYFANMGKSSSVEVGLRERTPDGLLSSGNLKEKKDAYSDLRYTHATPIVKDSI